MSRLVVSIHDASPATIEQTAWWVGQVESLGIRATILVIPGPWRGAQLRADDPFGEPLRRWEAAGHEISLHGWEHHQPGPRTALCTLVARGAGEFANLGSAAAESRLAAGLTGLASNGLASRGFTPPGWLLSPEARVVVKRMGFEYYTTHFDVHDVAHGRTLRVAALSHRPGSRLAGVGALTMRAGERLRKWTGADMRLAIHPDDIEDRRLVATTLATLEAAIASGARAMTYLELVRSA